MLRLGIARNNPHGVNSSLLSSAEWESSVAQWSGREGLRKAILHEQQIEFSSSSQVLRVSSWRTFVALSTNVPCDGLNYA
jgi:hypothetical protein